jgi:hypothetical protein
MFFVDLPRSCALRLCELLQSSLMYVPVVSFIFPTPSIALWQIGKVIRAAERVPLAHNRP